MTKLTKRQRKLLKRAKKKLLPNKPLFANLLPTEPGIGKSKLIKKVAKKLGATIVDINIGEHDAADLRGLPTWPTPRSWADVENVDKLRAESPEFNEFAHITNRLHPTLANRKPWPTWPVVEATDELHREFLSKRDADKLHEIKEELYSRRKYNGECIDAAGDDVALLRALFNERTWIDNLLDKWERS